MTREKPGRAASMPGVSAQPGCMALTVTPERSGSPSRRAHSRTSVTCALLARHIRVGRRTRHASTAIVEVKTLDVLPTRRDRDHPPPSALAQEGQQAGDEHERPHDHRRKGRLEPIGCLASVREHRAGVVDQHVEPRLALPIRVTAARTAAIDDMSATTVGKRSSPCAATSSSRTTPSRSRPVRRERRERRAQPLPRRWSDPVPKSAR